MVLQKIRLDPISRKNVAHPRLLLRKELVCAKPSASAMRMPAIWLAGMSSGTE